MKLHHVTMNNFMPYKAKARLDFPTDEQRNVMLVFGDNMRGKTSILNALRWGLYGRALGRHSLEIPLHEILNKDAAAEGDWTFEVHIEFEANGQTFDLRRRADKRAMVAIPQRPEDFQVQVHLAKDGIPVRGDQVEPEINQIAPQQVSRFFLFDGELLQEYETLLIEGSEQGQQIKEAIEEVLGVPALIRGRDELGAILKSARKAQQMDLKRVQGLDALAQEQANLTARQDALEKDLQALVAQQETVRGDRVKLDDEIEASQSVYQAKIKLDGLLDRKKSVEQFQAQKRTERLELLSVAWKDLLEVKVGVRREQLEKERQELTRQLGNKSVTEHRVNVLESLVRTCECPTCRQHIEESRREQMAAELGALQGELQNWRDSTQALQSVSAQIDALNKIRGANVRDRVAAIETDIQNYEVELTRAENEIERLRDEIHGYDTVDIVRRRALRDEKIKEEGRLQQDVANRKKDIDKIKGELAVAQKTIEGMSQARTLRSTTKARLCEDMESIFSQSIERLRDKLRETVQARADEAFHKMTTQSSYRGLEINGNYGLSIIDDLGRRVTVRSAGAEQVVALSLIDGLNRTGRAAGPVVMDTPFGRLDLKHRDNILTYLPSVTSQFVLLVHSGEIRPETDLAAIAARIGSVYAIKEVNARQSIIERETL
ncbi:AAA family ATPase [Bradyrhizobium sp. Ai1a-2]|uniref:AAA family ATPase n=1 Tax=Bradyrhizobium sp. Ai1a-2 TaxID=196490 RepID=UPI000429996E|nr:AAA family ATPase [Bradyrhizobium sp. Ai1a-2]